MENKLMILFCMGISGIIVYIYNRFKANVRNNKFQVAHDRFNYLKELESNGIIEKEIVYFTEDLKQKSQIKQNFMKKTRVIINGKQYTDKISWFMLDGTSLYVVGKKDNFLVELRLNKEMLEFYEE